jgi:hypothetical protein
MELRRGKTMAKTKEFHYMFKVISPTEARISKFAPDENEPLVVYVIRGQRGLSLKDDGSNSNVPQGSGNVLCDCPAAFRYTDRLDKHIDLLNRWQKILKSGAIPMDQMVYYNSRDDRFYRMGAALSEFLKE